MKRTLLLIAIAAISVIGVSSCKKCYNCEYKYQFMGDTITVPFPEECGKKADLDIWKASKEAEAKRHGVTLTCE
jgi:hypothetical protein